MSRPVKLAKGQVWRGTHADCRILSVRGDSVRFVFRFGSVGRFGSTIERYTMRQWKAMGLDLVKG